MGRLVAGAVAALALVLGACSGGGSGSSGNAAKGGEAQSQSTPATTSAVTSTTRPVDTSFSGRGSNAYCDFARSFSSAQQRFGTPGNANDLRALYQDAAKAAQQAVDVAPPEIKNDVRIIADGITQLAQALDRVNYDFTRLPPDIIVRFMSAEFQNASTRVAAYGREVCGLAG